MLPTKNIKSIINFTEAKVEKIDDTKTTRDLLDENAEDIVLSSKKTTPQTDKYDIYNHKDSDHHTFVEDYLDEATSSITQGAQQDVSIAHFEATSTR